MRLMLILIVLALCAPSPATAQNWTTIPFSSTDDILAMEQASFSDVWLVGRNGLVAVSNATRTVWTTENLGTTEDFHSVIRQTNTQVWVSGSNGTVYVKPTFTWNLESIGVADRRFVLFSRGSGVAHAVGDSGLIYRSTDLGMTWSPQNSGTTRRLNHGTGFNGATSWVVGDAGTILVTHDGGVNWAPQTSGTNANLNSIIERGSWLVVAGDAGTILRSNDSGMTWIAATTNVTENLNALSPSAFDASTFLVCGDNGTLLRTSDFGASWCSIDTETSANLNAVRYLGFTEIVIGGDGGLLKRSTNDGGSCVVPTAVGPAEFSSFAMTGPHPQPMRGSGVILLSSSRGEHVVVTVHDARGRRIGTVFDGRVDAGRVSRLQVNSRDWAAGVYFVRASGADAVRTRKMVVLE